MLYVLIVVYRLIKKYCYDIHKYPLLSKEEEKKLLQKIKDGDKYAEEELILKNLRLVIFIAGKYKGYGLDFQDLISEGNIGLIEAIRRFDITKGLGFIFYAALWINKSIIQALNSSDIIRIPEVKRKLINKIIRKAKTIIMVSKDIGREDLYKKISDFLNVDINLIKEVMNSYYKKNISIEEDTFSYIDPIEETVFNSILIDKIKIFLEDFSLIEREIINSRFFYEDKPISFTEIGKKLGINRGSLHYIQEIAIKKLKNKFLAE